ncbi:phosphatidylinositol-glycan biosynthesis class f protein-related [Anaeramoeba flamelloides]|uniref:Phosphatidylinositol-glycan biosynthesis class f protein-related n=1 Tax=Anaeramoeba flamelloides TaxID=1746091 RepID=A0ABQ8YTM3_9EUKA|nr:phosphatidylinositol-glycan biosynthesis class f protein-related [Anaeramoeba flamelloides]
MFIFLLAHIVLLCVVYLDLYITKFESSPIPILSPTIFFCSNSIIFLFLSYFYKLRKLNLQTLCRSLLGTLVPTFLGTIIVHLIFWLFGASLLEKIQNTYFMSLLFTSTSITPMAASFGFDYWEGWFNSLKVLFIFGDKQKNEQPNAFSHKQLFSNKHQKNKRNQNQSPKPNPNKERIVKTNNPMLKSIEQFVSICWIGSIVGSWLGMIPLNMDWDETWQKFPTTCYFGCIFGFSIFVFCSLIANTICFCKKKLIPNKEKKNK